MSVSFQTIDVFTHTRFLGNPLAIIILHHSDLDSDSNRLSQSLTQQQKQLLAREFNLSETVFIHTTQGNYDDPNEPFLIDIFTTTEELPFAGHPTIGAGWFLAQQWKTRTGFTLSTKAGEILVKKLPGKRSNEDVKFVRLRVPIDFKTHPPYHSPNLSTLKSKLHQSQLEPDDYVNGVDGAEPVASIVKGMSFVLIQLQNELGLAKFQPLHAITDAQLRISDDHLGDWKGFSSLYVFVVLPQVTNSHSSIFDGFEDPATGSAASTLCGWLAVQKGIGKWRFEVIQGVEIGRESRIGVFVDVDENSVVSKIELVGGAVKVLDGRIDI
ncbi:hypothetical protein F5050DRAFT_1571630 [Lentinula boryana]|uniref:Diaminopimelate epimerase-like protein n=1 Tax=Lentinula boryana TaxID=40481 RepID=A0ABQ8QD27_9AGAR|nr:hypothetical protein F5050DRAFT_1571630 [Lentinula boryana]